MKKIVIFIICIILLLSACEIHPEDIPNHPNIILETSTDEVDSENTVETDTVNQ